MEKMKQAAFLLLMAVMNATGVWMLLLRLLGEKIEQVDRMMGCALFACLVLLFLMFFSRQKNVNCHSQVLEHQG